MVSEWQEDAETVRVAYRQEEDGEIQPRLQALWLLREGHGLAETARLVSVHYVTRHRWIAW